MLIDIAFDTKGKIGPPVCRQAGHGTGWTCVEAGAGGMMNGYALR